MGLADVIQKAAQTAFKAIGNIPLICIYTSKGIPEYNVITGEYTSMDTDYENLLVLFENYTALEITNAGGVLLATDQKASIPNLSLPPEPKITDYITDPDSQKWTIENVRIDPAKALWIFQSRRSA